MRVRGRSSRTRPGRSTELSITTEPSMSRGAHEVWEPVGGEFSPTLVQGRLPYEVELANGFFHLLALHDDLSCPPRRLGVHRLFSTQVRDLLPRFWSCNRIVFLPKLVQTAVSRTSSV